MPRVKKQRKESTSDSDSGPDDKLPVKKAKPTPPAAKPKPSGDDDENRWEIGRNRNAALREFKGKWYVDIRESYLDANGDLKPGKKGIMLTMEQYQKLKSVIPDIDEAIKQNV